MVEIAGRVNKNFGSSIGKAEKRLGGLRNTLKKVGIAVSASSIAMAGANFLKDSVDQAIAYESTMADVAKVVDGLRDENGRLTESYYQMSDAILEMSTRIPMTAEEIGQIVTAAGQAGIATEDLLQFAEDAAKMGIAFDTTADQAGEWMATWRTAFGMSQTEVVALADQINYLGNTTSENTQKLSGVVTRIGSLGKTAGLSAADIAAMAASMTGVSEEISATGIKNLMLAMTAGSAATDKQAGVLNRLGFSAEQLAERMQVDAKGAVLDLLGAIKKLPTAEQSAVLTQYFGKESVAAIAPLLSNLEYLEEQFQKVGDASLYAGSMEAEYATRSDTTANKIQLAQNSINALKIQLGEKLLPVIGELADALSIGIDRLSEFFETHEEALPAITSFAGAITSAAIVHKAFNFATASGTVELAKHTIAVAKDVAETIILKGMYAKEAAARGLSTAALVAQTVAQRVLNGVMAAGTVIAKGLGIAVKLMAGPFGVVILVISALIAAGIALYKNWDTVKAKAQAIWGSIKDVFVGFKDEVIESFHAVIEAGKEMFRAFDEWVSNVPVIGSLYGGAKNIGSFLMKKPQPYNPIPAMASGGIVTAPTLSMIGEGGEPEAVMPLSKLERMLDGISSGGGGKIIFAPKIEIKGNADKKEVANAVRISFEEFKRMMEKYEREKRRVAF
ncbi:phage tail tape measure protein [Anaerotignum sp.]